MFVFEFAIFIISASIFIKSDKNIDRLDTRRVAIDFSEEYSNGSGRASTIRRHNSYSLPSYSQMSAHKVLSKTKLVQKAVRNLRTISKLTAIRYHQQLIFTKLNNDEE